MAKPVKLTLTAMLIAIVTMMTAFFRIPVFPSPAYIHAGDGILMLAGFIMGPSAILVGLASSILSELLIGPSAHTFVNILVKVILTLYAGCTLNSKSVHRVYQINIAAVSYGMIMIIANLFLEYIIFGYGYVLTNAASQVMHAAGSVLVGIVSIHGIRHIPAFHNKIEVNR